MNDLALPGAVLAEEHVPYAASDARFNSDLRFSYPDLISDDDLGLLQIGIDTEPGKPGGQIVFDTADYATDEEAMKAMEALFLPEKDVADDELATQD